MIFRPLGGFPSPIFDTIECDMISQEVDDVKFEYFTLSFLPFKKIFYLETKFVGGRTVED